MQIFFYPQVIHCFIDTIDTRRSNSAASSGANKMTKLINTFRAMSSPSNRVKLQTYLDRHMMAVCMATPEEAAFLRVNGFSI